VAQRTAIFVAAAIMLGLLAATFLVPRPGVPPQIAQPQTYAADQSDPNILTPAAKSTDDTVPDRPYDHSNMTAVEADKYYNEGIASQEIIKDLNERSKLVNDEFYGIGADKFTIWTILSWIAFACVALLVTVQLAHENKESLGAALRYVLTIKLFRWPTNFWDVFLGLSAVVSFITGTIQIILWMRVWAPTLAAQ
jgi:hypothetical protein